MRYKLDRSDMAVNGGAGLLGKEGALLACQCSAEDDASDSNRMCIASNIILKECHSQTPKS